MSCWASKWLSLVGQYVFMYACMHVCMYVYLHCTRTCAFTCVCVKNMHTCIHVLGSHAGKSLGVSAPLVPTGSFLGSILAGRGEDGTP